MVAAQAEIDYHVKVDPGQKLVFVTMHVPAKTGPVSIQIPNWSPGAYAYGNNYENVQDVKAVDASGASLTVEHPDKNTWSATATKNGGVTFSYALPTRIRGFGGGGGAPTEQTFIQLSGPSTYMYVLGRKSERCKVTFEVPKDWPVVTGLDGTGGGTNTYHAPTYDVLADNPISMGDIFVDKYTLRGVDHYVVLEGDAKKDVDRARLLKDARFVSAAETDFFGGAPYHKYVWHFSVYPAPDGAGGLEHLSSTQISLASGEGPRSQSVLAHEFFHLWNVKRIRSSVLGPFDYITLPKTGALWWLEGVTDYYATLLPYRYGEWKRDMFYAGILSNYNSVETNPAHLKVSPNDASMRVGDANGGRGNSNGFEISYYNLGWLCGLCLDTEIRAESHGKHSLDDVIHALFDECKNDKPGFAEDEIRHQCIRFGGEALGPFYDQVVMRPGELPIGSQLAKMGLVLQQKEEPFVDAGFVAAANRGRGIRVVTVRDAAKGKLQVGDTVQSMDGQDLTTMTPVQVAAFLKEHVEGASVGKSISLVVMRGEDKVTVSVDPANSTRTVRSVIPDASASAEAVRLREQWLVSKTPSVP